MEWELRKNIRHYRGTSFPRLELSLSSHLRKMNPSITPFLIFCFWTGIVRLFALDPITPDHFLLSTDSNQTEQKKINRMGEEKIRLSDNSELTGYLIRLDSEQNLFWQNKSISGEINFDYKSVSNIFF